MKENVMRHWTCVLSLCVLVGSPSLPAATLVVDPDGGGDYTEIQPAVAAAQDGDTVLVKAGMYVIEDPIFFRGDPVRNIHLRSEAGPTATTIRRIEKRTNPSGAVHFSGSTSSFPRRSPTIKPITAPTVVREV
jgi:hypothetical protein